MTRPVLFDYWRSSASYRVRIALNLLGIEHDTVAVDLLKGNQRGAENRARNPQGLVPSLEIDGSVLTQSLSIIEYLHETRETGTLLPATPVERQRVRAISHAIAMEIHPVCNLNTVAHVVKLMGGGDAEKIAWMQTFITNGLIAVEQMLADGKTGTFCHGTTRRWPTCASCRRFTTPGAGAST